MKLVLWAHYCVLEYCCAICKYELQNSMRGYGGRKVARHCIEKLADADHFERHVRSLEIGNFLASIVNNGNHREICSNIVRHNFHLTISFEAALAQCENQSTTHEFRSALDSSCRD